MLDGFELRFLLCVVSHMGEYPLIFVCIAINCDGNTLRKKTYEKG